MIDKVSLEGLKKTQAGAHLKRIGLSSHHGIILMLSAIHSKKSLGIGEFLDLLPLLPWASKVGLDFIQLLPITDSGHDNSPYNPISTLALNPVFLSIHALPYISENALLKKEYLKLLKVKKTPLVNYPKVRRNKLHFLSLYADTVGRNVRKNGSYRRFIRRNRWVYDYALFNVFSDEYNSHDWKKWQKNKQQLTPVEKTVFLKRYKKEVQRYLLMQFFCFEQMSRVCKEAANNGLFLFGDLPFLVSRDSCDVWSHPNLFLMDYSVGSPPDDLTPEGQNWDFPAYNWAELKKTRYRWWKERLKIAENFFQIYRLDHIIGFYRTWNIPRGKLGSQGEFSPKDPSEWLENGRSFLKELLRSSKMLPIGEDLVIPQSIIDSMRDLGICGTRILTWQRTGAGGLDFVPFELYTTASITHLASHDTATLSQWWKKYSKTAKEFSLWRKWRHTKKLTFEKRFDLLSGSHQTSSLFHANLLQEYLALFPELVHKSPNEERINYPGTPSKNNWRYRFIPTVEEISKNRKLTHVFKKIIHP
ncbi:MAG: 4-alpha-glucanotransferase [Chlamydiae bacterium]|nr:4-alpha-glucanotransferase [Chlamydiota bacterium]